MSDEHVGDYAVLGRADYNFPLHFVLCQFLLDTDQCAFGLVTLTAAALRIFMKIVIGLGQLLRRLQVLALER
ncbi:hypothetical protein D3C71_1653880 [compost metagenome]